MKKLKKSSNKKPTVIFLYGPQAVGKLTVAKILSKKLGYLVNHNHIVNDFVSKFFDRSTFPSHVMKEHIRFYLLEQLIRARMDTINTFCYAHDFISKTGLSDPEHMKKTEKMALKLKANFYPIHLKASNKELLKRVNTTSRKTFQKLRDKKIMLELIEKHDWQTSPKLKNNLIIDNTHLSPQKVSDMIIKHFKLQRKL